MTEQLAAMRQALNFILATGEHDQNCGAFDLDEEGRHCACTCGLRKTIDALRTAIEQAETAQGQEPVAFDDWPEYHEQAMGCGLEDRGITDRYEAMRYGWDEALERAWEAIELLGPLYTNPPAAALKPLTDEQVEKIIKSNMSIQMNLAGIRQDFEAAHGITGETK